MALNIFGSSVWTVRQPNILRWFRDFWKLFVPLIRDTGIGIPSSVEGARSGIVGRGSELQAGRSQSRFPILSLEFFIDIILPVALWPWGDSSSNRNEYQEYFLGVKAADAEG
jgi:hypothetical protein